MSKVRADRYTNRADDGAPTFSQGVNVVGSGVSIGIGASVYSPEDNHLALGTGGAERVHITSAGRVGIGTDDPGSNHKLHLYGATNSDIRMTATGDDIINIFANSNRSSANDSLFALKAEWNGTQVGNIKVNAGDDTTNKDDGYITFNTRESGAGSSTERLRILSSGGITFNGDTSSANALDDYEEGYWTPTVNSGGNPSSTLTVKRCRYTKVGRKVTICGEIVFSGGDGGNFRLSGLPFNLETTGTAPSGQTNSGMSAVGNVLFMNLNITGVSCLTAYLWSNLIYFYYTPGTDGAAWAEMDGDEIGGNSGGADLIFTVTYFTST